MATLTNLLTAWSPFFLPFRSKLERSNFINFGDASTRRPYCNLHLVQVMPFSFFKLKLIFFVFFTKYSQCSCNIFVYVSPHPFYIYGTAISDLKKCLPIWSRSKSFRCIKTFRLVSSKFSYLKKKKKRSQSVRISFKIFLLKKKMIAKCSVFVFQSSS